MDSSWGKIRWKVITLVREPIARAISDVFQNVYAIIPRINRLSEKEAFASVSEHILEHLNSFNEANDYVCTWFDREIKAVFELGPMTRFQENRWLSDL